jgi:hypothetical protein
MWFDFLAAHLSIDNAALKVYISQNLKQVERLAMYEINGF